MNRIIKMMKMKGRGGRFPIAAGLLILLRLTECAYARNADETPVLVRTSPEIPLAGSVWVLTLLIDHPLPEEVTVSAPSFEEALLPDRVSKVPHTETADSVRRTLAEYRFIPQKAGTFVLGVFTVSTPKGEFRTLPITVNVQNPGAARAPLRLVWEKGPESLIRGEAAVLNLRVSGEAGPTLPGAELLMPAVPPGFILEAEQPAQEAAGSALKLRAIPLDAAALDLPPRTVFYGDAAFEIPALYIPVKAASPAPEQGAAAAGDAGGAEPAGAGGKVPATFPEFESSARPYPLLFRLFGGSIENAIGTAKDFWERGYRAEALAELRRNERDHPAGPVFKSLRQEAERSLALPVAEDESRWTVRLAVFLLCCVLALAALASGLRLFPSCRKKTALVCAAVFIAAALAYHYPGRAAFSGQSRSGVMKETDVRRAPDPAGETVFRFSEGRPVRAGSGKSGPWVFVSSRDEEGAAGWVPEEKIVFYSR
ncbi:MAG: BatD family protein [Treponema sp.]|jgi:hypothetical protein|nr:BatD family protein [Treponema sp.]